MRRQNRTRLNLAPRWTHVSLAGVFAVAIVAAPILNVALAGEPIATLRGSEINQEPVAPKMPKQSKTELREVRNYPEQPPMIPHSIRNYNIDLNSNKCLNCHSRTAVGRSQAPMVSVTHFMNRDGQVLSSVTSRRYFCNQCHVMQLELEPLVGNTFIDADSVSKKRK